MANVFDYINSKLNSFRASVQNTAIQAGSSVQHWATTPRPPASMLQSKITPINYTKPIVPQVQNTFQQSKYDFWNTGFGNTLANTQKFIESPKPVQPFNIIPSIKKPKTIAGQGYNLARDMGVGIGNTLIGEGVINPSIDVGRLLQRNLTGQDITPYNQLKSAPARLGYNIKGYNNTPQQVIGNVAGSALPPLTAYGGGKVLGIGPDVVRQAAANTILTALKKGAIGGFKFGALYGGVQGLSDNRNAKNVPTQLLESGKQALLNGIVGGVLGGALGAGGYTVSKAFNAVKNAVKAAKPEIPEQDAQKLAHQFLRDELGRFAKGQKAPKNEQPWIGDVREQLGLPRYGNDPQSGFVKIDELLGKKKIPLKEDKFIQDLEKRAAKSKYTEPQIPKEPNYDFHTKEDAEQIAGRAQYNSQEGDSFNKLFSKWIGQRDAATTKGTIRGSQIKSIPKEKASELSNYIRAEKKPTRVSPEVKIAAEKFRKLEDELYKEAQDMGLDIGYLKEHISNIWKESPAEIALKVKNAPSNMLGTSFKFAGHRTISYNQGLRLGLTPKYTHPASILADYASRLEQTKANLDFFKALKKEGLIVHGSIGSGRSDFAPISVTGFPRSISVTGEGKIFQGNWYAPTAIAQRINKLFSAPNTDLMSRGLSRTGKLSSGTQDIFLSGGVKDVNAFTVAQGLKETLAGRPVRTVQTFYDAWSPKRSASFFQENAPQIIKMQERNIPVNSIFNPEKLVPNSVVRKTLGEKMGNLWNRAVNDPTFKRFMPMMQVRYFNDIEAQALKKGQTAQQAADVAANATKNFYGIVGSDTAATRSRVGQDAIKTFFFAPKYRESMINFWVNNVKAIGHPLALENRGNIKFAVGATLLYVAMNNANRALNGKNMWENPPGKEDMLLIPLPDGQTIGVPFLSSIATVPRNAIKTAVHLAQGNLKQAGADIRTNLSMLTRPFADIIVNQNYFGQDVYDEQDAPQEKYKKIGLYLARSYNHPYIGAIIDRYAKDDPLYTSVSKALELPFRFYKTDKLEAGYYYQARDKYLGQLTPADRMIYDKLHGGGIVDEDGLPVYNKRSDMANALDRLAHPQVLQAEANTAMQTSQKTGQPLNPFYQLDPKQQETVLILKTLYPGDKTKSTITKANIAWLEPYWAQRDQFVGYLKQKGVIQENSSYQQAPQPNPQLQSKLDYYNTLPSGTGARSGFLRANPDVLQFFNESRDFTNAQRADLGLPLLEGYGSSGGYASGGAKTKTPKKIAVGKAKSFKAKGKKLSINKKQVKVKFPKAKKSKYLSYTKKKKGFKTPPLPKLKALES